ncbi:MAG: DsbE family thiol:disulfide interchange protein [Xanthomonadales bacterium]|nr:DsbE family thiol:disulfide interchange protein [Xanthomonadales bacterium]
MKLSAVLPLGVFLVLGILLASGIGKDPTQIPSPLLDKPAPEFELPVLGREPETLSKKDLSGAPYLLNVWASWCPACQIEHPYITELAERGPVPVYGLNWKDAREDAIRWLDFFGDPYRASLFDGDGRTGIDFGVYGAPETFLIGADGRVLEKHIGPLDAAAFQEKFAPLIQGQATGAP